MRRCVGEEAHTYPPDAHCTWYLGAWGACAREANTIRQLATICRFDQHSTVRVRTFISNLSQVAPSCHTPFSPWNAILKSTGQTINQRRSIRNRLPPRTVPNVGPLRSCGEPGEIQTNAHSGNVTVGLTGRPRWHSSSHTCAPSAWRSRPVETKPKGCCVPPCVCCRQPKAFCTISSVCSRQPKAFCTISSVCGRQPKAFCTQSSVCGRQPGVFDRW